MKWFLLIAITICSASLSWAIRPTDGEGWAGNGYGDLYEVYGYESAGGHFKIWYTVEGPHAVDGEDVSPSNGIPDFVELMASVFDEVRLRYIDQLEFAPPLDDSIYHDRPDYGGDGRFDVYLQNIPYSDGYIVTEVCTSVGGYRCSAYMVVENDFAGFGYASAEEAARTLASHEFFHVIQNAYDADQKGFWTEGTAVWATEQIFPELQDFESFLPGFFQEPDVALDYVKTNTPADPRIYGAAIWPWFLSERFGGPQVVLRIWEACVDVVGDNPSAIEAAAAVLETQYNTSLAQAFAEFALWNFYTGPLADPRVSYASGADYPTVKFEPLESQWPATALEGKLAHLAARYWHATLDDAPPQVRLELEGPDTETFVLQVLVARPGSNYEPLQLQWSPLDGMMWTVFDRGSSTDLGLILVNVRHSGPKQPYVLRIMDANEAVPEAADGAGGPLEVDAGEIDTGAADTESETDVQTAGDSEARPGGENGGGCAVGSSPMPPASCLLVLLLLLWWREAWGQVKRPNPRRACGPARGGPADRYRLRHPGATAEAGGLAVPGKQQR